MFLKTAIQGTNVTISMDFSAYICMFGFQETRVHYVCRCTKDGTTTPLHNTINCALEIIEKRGSFEIQDQNI